MFIDISILNKCMYEHNAWQNGLWIPIFAKEDQILISKRFKRLHRHELNNRKKSVVHNQFKFVIWPKDVEPLQI